MKNRVKLVADNNCFYLTQSLRGLNLYERTKAINNFVKNETKILESCVEIEIKAIFERNGLSVYDTNESVLNALFSALKSKGKEIRITDIYQNAKLDNCIVVGTSENKMTCVLEDDEILQCGIALEEIKLF